MQKDIDTPVLATLATSFIARSRLERLCSAALSLPITAADDRSKETKVPWDSDECSAFVRRYSNETRQGIKWHADASAYTINIALNSAAEYTGGELMAMLDTKIQVVAREGAGCATVHGANILHTVKSVSFGERFSLVIFIRKEDGIGLRKKWRQKQSTEDVSIGLSASSLESRLPATTVKLNSEYHGIDRKSNRLKREPSFDKQLVTYAVKPWDHNVIAVPWRENSPIGYNYFGQALEYKGPTTLSTDEKVCSRTIGDRPVNVIQLRRATMIGFEGLLVQPGPRWTFKMLNSSNGPAGIIPPRPARELLAEELTRGLLQVVPGEVLLAGDGVPLRLRGSAFFFSHICNEWRKKGEEITPAVLFYNELDVFGYNEQSLDCQHTIRKIPSGRPCVSIITQYSLNYFHFLMKSAPMLVAALKCLSYKNILVATYGSTHALELCALLGLQNSQLIIFQPNELLLTDADQMHCVSGLNPSTDFPSQNTVKELRQAILPRVQVDCCWSEMSSKKVKVLLLDRRGQGTRVLAKIDRALVEEAILQHFGGNADAFDLISPPSWPPPKVIGGQHALFSTADVVIGPHGAALANCIWMKNQSMIIELKPGIRRGWLEMPGNEEVGEYEILSQLSPGVRYAAAPVKGDWDVRNIVVDSTTIDAIKTALVSATAHCLLSKNS